jgi:MOSC domain-containing protein YiiM
MGIVVSVNVGAPRKVTTTKRVVRTAIWKAPVAGRVAVRGVNVAGDEQADRTVHGGPDKAVYAYAIEDTEWWKAKLTRDAGLARQPTPSDERTEPASDAGPAQQPVSSYAQAGSDRPLGPGAFGENLTFRGVDVSGALIGERWAVGTTVLEVCQPRLPCFKLGLRMGDPRFPRRFAAADRPGAYLRIIRPGDIGAGDAVEVVERPDHDVTVALVARAYLRDHTALPHLLTAPALPEDWRAIAAEAARAAQPGARSAT